MGWEIEQLAGTWGSRVLHEKPRGTSEGSSHVHGPRPKVNLPSLAI